MIELRNVTKAYKLEKRRHLVLDDVSVTFPQNCRIGILGGNGAGKSTLLRLIAGGEEATSGKILRKGRISFPMGFTGTFHPLYSARENVRFLCDIYGMDHDEVVGWIEDFVELGDYFDMPVNTFSSGMGAKMAFGVSFAFDFDTYLVDEAIEVGDARFRRKCAAVFRERLQSASLILVSQHAHTMREYCREGAVLHKGKLTMFPDMDSALEYHEQTLRKDFEEAAHGDA